MFGLGELCGIRCVVVGCCCVVGANLDVAVWVTSVLGVGYVYWFGSVAIWGERLILLLWVFPGLGVLVGCRILLCVGLVWYVLLGRLLCWLVLFGVGSCGGWVSLCLYLRLRVCAWSGC